MKIFTTVRTRLTLWYVGVLALVLLGFSAGLYAQLARSINERLDEGLRATLTLMADTFARDLAEGLAEAAELKKTERIIIPEDLIEQDVAQGTAIDLSFPQQATAIFASDGRRMAEKIARDGFQASLPASLNTEEKIAGQAAQLFTLPTEKYIAASGLRVAVQRVPGATKGAPFLIVVAQSLATNEKELYALRRIFLFAVPLALLFAGLSGYFLARKSLAPVAALSQRAQQITAENLAENVQAQLPVANPSDELGQLATAFNTLLTRLNTSFDQQRQFMADASHELRTPLSVIHATTEITLDHAASDADESREALASIQRQSERLMRLVEDMFTLARADAGRRPLHYSLFYLDELIAEIADAARVLATSKTITIEVTSLAETTFRGDEDLLRQMLLNLLDNAIRHTPKGGRVCLSFVQSDSVYEIAVTDSGAGIPAAAQSRIFERFYRVDESRSRAVDDGGAGLGLSIARWIAEAHDGRLVLRRSDASGSVFVATLPVKPD